MSNTENYFVALNSVNVNEHTEKKNGLTYLSWAWAWGEIKKKHPDATYTIYENENGCFYHTDGRTCWVKTGVTVNGIEHIEYLPVMDHRNKSIPIDGVTSFDVNKAVQRSLTKACARHGLGLYIYAGEDLPEGEDEAPTTRAKKGSDPYPDKEEYLCIKCGKPFVEVDYNGKKLTPKSQYYSAINTRGEALCKDCYPAKKNEA